MLQLYPFEAEEEAENAWNEYQKVLRVKDLINMADGPDFKLKYGWVSYEDRAMEPPRLFNPKHKVPISNKRARN